MGKKEKEKGKRKKKEEKLQDLDYWPKIFNETVSGNRSQNDSGRSCLVKHLHLSLLFS